MITTIRSIGQFSAENFNDAFSENYSLAQANIPIKLYEYQKQQSKQRYKCSFYLGDPALMLAIPKPKLTNLVNDVPQTTDDLSR
jgi:hypothetical protein